MSGGGKIIPYYKPKSGNPDEQWNGLFGHPKFFEDFQILLPDKGKSENTRRKLRTKLRIVLEEKTECRQPWFERLKGTKGMYRIKLPGEVNLRILLVFRTINNVVSAILLHAFAEKDNKRGGGNSYSDAIKIATRRLNELGIENAEETP